MGPYLKTFANTLTKAEVCFNLYKITGNKDFLLATLKYFKNILTLGISMVGLSLHIISSVFKIYSQEICCLKLYKILYIIYIKLCYAVIYHTIQNIRGSYS